MKFLALRLILMKLRQKFQSESAQAYLSRCVKAILAKFAVYTSSGLALLILLFLSSCVASVRTTTYFDEVSEEYIDLSQPIEVSLEEYVGPKTTAILLLERNRSQEKYFIKVRWNIESKYRPHILSEDSLKFMIDDKIWYNFSPTKPPQILTIKIEPQAFEEEAIYEISREFLEICLRANEIKVFVSGRKLALKGDLSSKIQKLSFRDFLEHAQQ
jgi:hypothetical protein